MPTTDWGPQIGVGWKKNTPGNGKSLGMVYDLAFADSCIRCSRFYSYSIPTLCILDRGCCTEAKNLGLERLGLAHRWLWAVLQKRHTRVLRIWWKKFKHRYSSNESFCVFILEELCQTSSSGVSSKVGFSTWESVKGWGHWFLSRNIFFPKNSAAIQGELQFTGFHLHI